MEDSRSNGLENETENFGRLFEEFQEASYEEWKEEATALLKGKPFEKALLTKTPEGLTLQPIYNKEALDKLPHTDVLPGFAPYVRGTRVEGYTLESWLISQELYKPKPKEFNEMVMKDLFRGQTGLNIGLDEATRLGLDPDNAKDNAIGKRGLSLATLEDLTTAFKDLVLDALPLYVNVGLNPIALIAMLGAYAKKAYFPYTNIKGVVGYDPLGLLAKTGSLSYSLKEGYDLMADVLEYNIKSKSSLRTILVEGHTYHNAGADSVTELAYSIATLSEYIREMLDRGINIDDITKKTALSYSLGSNFFMEIAKLRAARVLFSQVAKTFGASDEAQKSFIHAKTSSWTKTVYDPYVNMLRNASEAFSGAIGGADSMDVVPFDEPIRESDSFSRRISRNVQAILQDECHFVQPIDPAGGSWYIETLTHEMAKNAWGKFQEIEAEGGMTNYLLTGKAKAEVNAKYEERFNDFAKRKQVLVGTNMYPNLTEKPLEKRDIDYDKIKKDRIEEVKKYKNNQDVFTIANLISEIGDLKDSNGKFNIEMTIEAIIKGATIGNITDLIHSPSNEGVSIEPIKELRAAKRFEALRAKTEELKAKNKDPKVFLINIGPVHQHKPRADFSKGFFEVGGFEVINNKGFDTSKEAAEAFLKSGANIGVICSTDAVYPEVVPQIAKDIKDNDSKKELVVAGKPDKELENVYREAGVDDFIFMGADCYSLLSKYQKKEDDNE